MGVAGSAKSAKIQRLAFHSAFARFGPRLCESNVEFARRNIVSIAFNRKRTLLPITVERRQDRKQFCALSARAGFHAAWTRSGQHRFATFVLLHRECHSQ